MDILCIYHGKCADGFGAAWAVRKALGRKDVTFHAGVYQEDPPDVTGKHVILVDFSYKKPVLVEMADNAQSILVLDHHKSAFEDLCDFEEPEGDWSDHVAAWHNHTDPMQWVHKPFVRALFDMKRSGAGMTWDFFHPNVQRPALINHIEDRDLWRFALDGTREIQANLFSYPYKFEVWDRLMALPTEDLRKEGEAIERKHFKDINELLEICERTMEIGGHTVPVASLPYTLTSDAGHQMAQGKPFAACYWDTKDARIFSLRSTDNGMDVSAIAREYGGGGHQNAAGFQVPRDHELAVS